MLIPPFVFLKFVPDVIESQKAFTVRVFLVLALAFAVFSRRSRTRLNRPFALLLCLNISWLFFTLWFHHPTREHQLVVIDRALAFFAIALIALFPPRGRRFEHALLGLASVLGAVAFFGFLCRYLPKEWSPIPAGRMIATFSHPNLFAQYAAPLVPVLAGLALASRRRNQRRFYYLLFPLTVIPLLLTYTRGAIIAAGLGCALTVSAAIFMSERGKRPIRTSVVLMLLLALSACVFWGFDRPSKKRAVVLRELPTISTIQSSSFSARLALWRQGLEVIRSSPLLGCGAGRMRDCMAAFRRPKDPEGRLQHTDVHQDYVQVAAEFGLPALVFYLALLLFLVRTALTVIRRGGGQDADRIYRIALLAGAATFLVHGFISFPLSRSLPRLYAFVFLGWAAAPGLVDVPKSINKRFLAASTAAALLFLGSLFYIGIIIEGNSFNHMIRARQEFRRKNPKKVLAACLPIIRDRGNGFYRRATCLGLTRRQLGPETTIFLEQLAKDFPGNHRTASLLAGRYLFLERYGDVCREVERGWALWPKNPRWKILAGRAAKQAKDTGHKAACSRALEKLAQ